MYQGKIDINILKCVEFIKLIGHHMQRQYLIPSLLFSLLLTANNAQAYTLGNMEISSGLNQKLDADLPIHLGLEEGRPDIGVRMAAPIHFERLKITRHSQLDDLQFKRIGTVIHFTSKHAINVPSLDFVIEVKSPKGLSYHHYTINLNQQATRSKVISRSIAASQLLKTAVAINAKPAPLAKPVATIADRLHKDNTFGPTQATDSLSGIAQQLAKTRGVPPKTILIALRRNNAKAFYKGVHGTLKLGEYLQLPDIQSSNSHTATTTGDNSPSRQNVVAVDMTTQQLLTRVEHVEHNVEHLQIQLTILQAQVPANLSLANPITATPIDLSTSSQSAATLIGATLNTRLGNISSTWLIMALALSLLSLLTWIVSSLIKIKRFNNAKNRPASSNENINVMKQQPIKNNFADLVHGMQDEELCSEMEADLPYKNNAPLPPTSQPITETETISYKPILVKLKANVINIKLLNEATDESAVNPASNNEYSTDDDDTVLSNPSQSEVNATLATTSNDLNNNADNLAPDRPLHSEMNARKNLNVPLASTVTPSSETNSDEPTIINIETNDIYQADDVFEFDFDFAKPQANTMHTKKTHRGSRYPLNTDNKPKK